MPIDGSPACGGGVRQQRQRPLLLLSAHVRLWLPPNRVLTSRCAARGTGSHLVLAASEDRDALRFPGWRQVTVPHAGLTTPPVRLSPATSPKTVIDGIRDAGLIIQSMAMSVLHQASGDTPEGAAAGYVTSAEARRTKNVKRDSLCLVVTAAIG